MQTHEIRKPEEANFFSMELKYQRILFSLFQELDLSTTILLSFSNENYIQLIKLISLVMTKIISFDFVDSTAFYIKLLILLNI